MVQQSRLSMLRYSVPEPREADAQFIKYFLNSKQWFDEVLRYATGTTRPRISRTRLEQMDVPVPPLAEQKRMVKLLDEADELRKLRAQADRRTASLISALFDQMFGGHAEKEKDWPKMPLGEVTTRVTKGESPGWQGFQYTNEGPIFITSENVLWGSLDLGEPKYIPPAFHQKLRRSAIKANDVLLNLVGASIGRCCMVPEGLGEANVNQAVAVISCGHQILPQFLTTLLLSQKAQNYFHGGKVEAARANISLADIRRYEAMIRPLALQQKFAERVGEIHRLESGQADSRRRLDDLFQSMLHRAFNGEL
jgi:type I restriction enzyme, S subunit